MYDDVDLGPRVGRYKVKDGTHMHILYLVLAVRRFIFDVSEIAFVSLRTT